MNCGQVYASALLFIFFLVLPDQGGLFQVCHQGCFLRGRKNQLLNIFYFGSKVHGVGVGILLDISHIINAIDNRFNGLVRGHGADIIQQGQH